MRKSALLLLASVLLTSGCHTVTTKQEIVYNYSQGDYLKAYRGANNLANTGDPVAQYATGYMLFYGVGTARDKDRARYYIRQSANRGYPPAVAALKMISEDHPNMRVEPLGRTTPIRYSGNVDASILVHDVGWLRERNPTHYTIELHSKAINEQIVTALASKNQIDLAKFKELENKQPESAMSLGDFENPQQASIALAMLDEKTAQAASISKFKHVQDKMLPE